MKLTAFRIPPASAAARLPLALTLIAAMFAGTAANAQERREHRPEFREPYRTPHMYYDDRYRHGHYYPSIGYSVSVLPPGYLSVRYARRHLFFQGGVWFESRGPGFIVVRPPIGAVVPVLPPAYSTVWVAGVPYYYADDVYYAQGPGGYVVAAPPAEGNYVEQAPAAPAAPQAPYAPPAAAAPQAPAAGPSAPSAGGMWYYCESAKGYYPYVQDCREGWRAVQPVPPPQNQ